MLRHLQACMNSWSLGMRGCQCYKRLGLLSQTVSNLDQAMLHIEDALASFLF